jgi:hypothetical protein
MGLRNTLIVGALFVGLVAIIILYVRRGFNDLQGQIDAIETMLASLPPELTSGDPSEYAHPTYHPPPLASSVQLVAGGGEDAPDPAFAPDEEPEGVDENDYTDYGDYDATRDYDATPHYADETEIPEYDLYGGSAGVATLSEPGVYETGVTQITVLPAGADQDIELELGDSPDGDEDPEDEHESERGEDEGEENDGADGIEGDGADGDGDEPVEDDAESSALPPPPPGDELNMLTLPQLKARLKAVQPDMRGIARMKRAEVLDRLRSLPVEEGEE